MNEKYIDIRHYAILSVTDKYTKMMHELEEMKNNELICINICGLEPFSVYKKEEGKITYHYFTVKLKGRKLATAMYFIGKYYENVAFAFHNNFVIRPSSTKHKQTECKYAISDNRMLDQWAVKTRVLWGDTNEYNFTFVLDDTPVINPTELSVMAFGGKQNAADGISEVLYYSDSERETIKLMQIIAEL